MKATPLHLAKEISASLESVLNILRLSGVSDIGEYSNLSEDQLHRVVRFTSFESDLNREGSLLYKRWCRRLSKVCQSILDNLPSKDTVAGFAIELQRSTDTLLEQLRSAGVPKASASDPLSLAEKQKLLVYLQASHGTASVERKKITLVKKSPSEIKQADASGKARTIQVEVRKKRTFIKRDDAPEGLLAEAAPVHESEPEARALPLIENAELTRLDEEARRQTELIRRQEEELAEKRRQREEQKAHERDAAEHGPAQVSVTSAAAEVDGLVRAQSDAREKAATDSMARADEEAARAADLSERRRKAEAEAAVIRSMMATPKKVLVRKQAEHTTTTDQVDNKTDLPQQQNSNQEITDKFLPAEKWWLSQRKQQESLALTRQSARAENAKANDDEKLFVSQQIEMAANEAEDKFAQQAQEEAALIASKIDLVRKRNIAFGILENARINSKGAQIAPFNQFVDAFEKKSRRKSWPDLQHILNSYEELEVKTTSGTSFRKWNIQFRRAVWIKYFDTASSNNAHQILENQWDAQSLLLQENLGIHGCIQKTPDAVNHWIKNASRRRRPYRAADTSTWDSGIDLSAWLSMSPDIDNKTYQHPLAIAHLYLSFTYSILNVLKSFHESGLIHGNLRPENIVIPAIIRREESVERKSGSIIQVQPNWRGLTLIDLKCAVHTRHAPQLFIEDNDNELPIHLPNHLSDHLRVRLIEFSKQPRSLTKNQRKYLVGIDWREDLYQLGYLLAELRESGSPSYLIKGDLKLSHRINKFVDEFPEKLMQWGKDAETKWTDNLLVSRIQPPSTLPHQHYSAEIAKLLLDINRISRFDWLKLAKINHT